MEKMTHDEIPTRHICACGMSYEGLSWQTLCIDCYKIKKQSEEKDIEAKWSKITVDQVKESLINFLALNREYKAIGRAVLAELDDPDKILAGDFSNARKERHARSKVLFDQMRPLKVFLSNAYHGSRLNPQGALIRKMIESNTEILGSHRPDAKCIKK